MMMDLEIMASKFLKEIIDRIADCEEYQIVGGSQYHKEEEKKIAYEDIKEILYDQIRHEMVLRGYEE